MNAAAVAAACVLTPAAAVGVALLAVAAWAKHRERAEMNAQACLDALDEMRVVDEDVYQQASYFRGDPDRFSTADWRSLHRAMAKDKADAAAIAHRMGWS